MNDLKNKFDILLHKWKTETSFISSVSEIIKHPAYQEIIKMGPDVLPFIFSEMEQGNNNWWAPALHKLTGAQPVPRDHIGHVDLIRKDWLKWARENGYEISS